MWLVNKTESAASFRFPASEWASEWRGLPLNLVLITRAANRCPLHTKNCSPKDAPCWNSLEEKQQLLISEDVTTDSYETDGPAGGAVQPLPLYVKHRVSYLGWPAVLAGICLFSLFCLHCFSFRFRWRSAERRSTGDCAFASPHQRQLIFKSCYKFKICSAAD